MAKHHRKLGHRIVDAEAISARLGKLAERIGLQAGYLASKLLNRALDLVETLSGPEAERALAIGFALAPVHGRRSDDHPEPSRSRGDSEQPSRRASPEPSRSQATREPSRSRGDSGQAASADDDGSGVTLAQAKRALTELEKVGSVRQQAAAIDCTHRALERLRAQVLRGGANQTGELPPPTQAGAWTTLRAAIARL